MYGEEFPRKSKIPLSEVEQAKRHLFLCIGPDCCSPATGSDLWDILKAEAKHLPVPILRTKAGCLRVCKDGPWLVVYPEGTWYGRMTPERLRRVLKEHIVEGHPVREWISAKMPCLVRREPKS
ncbi:ferredoxin [soil metagenome]